MWSSLEGEWRGDGSCSCISVKGTAAGGGGGISNLFVADATMIIVTRNFLLQYAGIVNEATK